MQLLLDAGADTEAQNEYEHDAHTPLMYAMAQNRPEAVTLLIARGANISDGRAASKGALFGSKAALMALMTSPQWLAMSRIERLQAEGGLLHHVQENSTLDAVRILVADMPSLVRLRSAGENTALHTAALRGCAAPVMCALIKEGVDPTTRNDAHQTPADVARQAGHALQATLLDRAAEDKRKRDLQRQQQQQQRNSN